MRNTLISREESTIISAVRTIAMLLIVLCHVVGWFPKLAFAGQLLNVGVPVFFIISGYLYGHKDIRETKPWYVRQAVKILLPVYLYTLICIIALICAGRLGSVDPVKCLAALLNLGGFAEAEIGNVTVGHLWFISFILLCYLITPLLQKFRDKLTFGKAAAAAACLSAVEIPLILLTGAKGFITWLPGVFLYILAYYSGAYWDKKISNRMYLSLTAAMILSVGLRLAAKRFSDSGRLSTAVYESVISPYTHCVLAFWIFITIYLALSKSRRSLDIAEPVCKVCGPYSYEVYICHNMFIKGVLSLSTATSSMAVNLLLFAAATVLSAVVLKKVSDMITDRFGRHRGNN